MSTLVIETRAAAVQYVTVSEDSLMVDLVDGRTVSVPLAWYPTLLHATDRERRGWKTCGAGTGIHWVALDYHLSAEGLLAGLPEAPGIRAKQPALQDA